MKLKKLLLLSMSFLSVLDVQPRNFRSYIPAKLQVPHNFGKTNFIVGYPHGCDKTARLINASQQTDEINEAFFSPDDDLQEKLISYIQAEQEAISIAIFSFTDKEIAQALCQAKKRGVHIEVIVDPGCLSDRFGKIACLRDAGINVYVYDPTQSAKHKAMFSNIMHNKFVIFKCNKKNKMIVWTGSFNFTKSARITNQENVIVTSQPAIIKKFTFQFNRLKGRTLPYDVRQH